MEGGCFEHPSSNMKSKQTNSRPQTRTEDATALIETLSQRNRMRLAVRKIIQIAGKGRRNFQNLTTSEMSIADLSWSEQRFSASCSCGIRNDRLNRLSHHA